MYEISLHFLFWTFLCWVTAHQLANINLAYFKIMVFGSVASLQIYHNDLVVLFNRYFRSLIEYESEKSVNMNLIMWEEKPEQF